MLHRGGGGGGGGSGAAAATGLYSRRLAGGALLGCVVCGMLMHDAPPALCRSITSLHFRPLLRATPKALHLGRHSLVFVSSCEHN